MRVLLLLLVAALAGCAQSDEAPDAPLVTDTTGLVRGVVVDPAVVPIEGAEVTLQDGTATQTDAEGAFLFTDLPGGVVSLTVSKPGYSAATTTATVQPGVAEPERIKVQLSPDPTTGVYVEEATFSGFVSQAVTVAGARAGDSDAPDQVFDTLPDWFQVEMVWRSTQALGETMELTFISYEEGATTGSDFSRAIGPSPLANGISKEQMVEQNLGGANIISLAIFAAPGDPVPVGVTLDQSFDLFIHRFHGFTPPEGWQFSVDGVPEP